MGQTTGGYDFRVEINFRAGSPGQTLTFRHTRSNNSGAINIKGAALTGTGSALPLPFTDDFANNTADDWLVADETSSVSDWQATGGEYVQNNLVNTAEAQIESYRLSTISFLAGGQTLTDYEFRVSGEFLSDGVQNDIGVVFRYVDPLNYYRATLSARFGALRVEKQVNGVFTPIATNTRGYAENEQLDFRISAVGDDFVVSINGDKIIAFTDSDLPRGTVGMTAQDLARFDDVSVDLPSTAPEIALVSPLAFSTTSGDDIVVTANALNVPAGGYVEFVLDGTIVETDSSAPYSTTFNSVAPDNHTIEAILYDVDDLELSSDTNVQVGTGGLVYLAVGDSTINGSGDLYRSDNLSSSGRIIASQSFEAPLNDLLDASTSVENNWVINEGIGGDTTEELAEQRLSSIRTRHVDVDRVLVGIGTNDALLGVPSGLGCSGAACDGTFKGDLQNAIDRIVWDDFPTNSISSGITAYVALVPPEFSTADPFTSVTNDLIRDYNTVISTEITNISLGPDLFNYFLPDQNVNFESLYGDTVHPNGLGYQVVAALWHNEFEFPVDLPFVLDDLQSSTSTDPEQDLIEVGDEIYLDNSHRITGFPTGLEDGRWLQLDNGDLGTTSAAYLAFDVDRAVDVYVAYDAAATVLPEWLDPATSSFVAVNETVDSDNPNTPTYDLYVMSVGTGSVILGGASRTPAAGAQSNMLVIVVED